MKLQVSPNNWTCMATSVAMALDKPVHEILLGLGHDGSDCIWPPPYSTQKAGHHIHEVIDYVWMYHSKPVTPFIRTPMVTPSERCQEQKARFVRASDLEHRFVSRLFGRVGIITGSMVFGRGHAVAWDGHKIYDPRGYIYPYNEAEVNYHFYADVFWMFGGQDASSFAFVP